MRFLLVHSPVLGPATWRGVAEQLGSAGHAVVVPDLRDLVSKGDPSAMIAGAVEAELAAGPRDADGHVAVVGHSGAGALLPAIAAAIDAPVRSIVFVDAGLPPHEGATSIGGGFLDHLRTMTVDGVVPRWSQWWGDDALAALVPDDAARAAIEAQLRSVPLALFEALIDVPQYWDELPCAYLLLSEAYRRDANTAGAWGWPVHERTGGHLDILTEPAAIATTLADLVR